MLRIEEIAPNRGSDNVRHELREQDSFPAEKTEEQHTDPEMHHKRDQTVQVLPRMIKKRIDTHPEQEHEKVAKEDGQRMAHEEILGALAPR